MRRHAHQGSSALDLLEEAVHRLRLAPVGALAAYYLGALPFVLGLLFFWADMSRGSYGGARLPAAAFGLAVLFLWMKAWQSVFAGRLLAGLCGEPVPPLKWREFVRAAMAQAILQPSGLFLLPLAALALLPLGFVYAFYQNITVLGDGQTTELRPLVRRAGRLAMLWPSQNHLGVLTLKLFGLFVFFNLVTGFLAVPFLLKILLGVESVFTRSVWAVLNPSFFAVVAALTYLCVDPLAKTFFVLRCFYGESLRTGQDLRAELRGLAAGNRLALIGLVILLAWDGAPGAVRFGDRTAEADRSSSAPLPTAGAFLRKSRNSELEASSSFFSADLDRAIAETLRRREFDWRLPRERIGTETETGPVTSFLRSVAIVLQDWFRTLGDWIGRLVRAIFGNRLPPPRPGDSGAWMTRLQEVMLILLVGLACLLGVLLVRVWQRRRRQPEEVAAHAAPAVPDVADDNVGADQLPEEGWSRLARELLDQGELRLALRALYLASLAHLAQKQLVGLARFKSNRDYERELSRRRHVLPELVERFSENVALFDRVWYGRHEVTPEVLERFTGNVEKIKANT